MQDWCAPDHEPLMIVRGEGSWLFDDQGNRYLDGNASIWTNIHGHGRPEIVSAIQDQAARLAHVSALGFANEPAALLAAALVDCFPPDTLTKVFFSDDGSTAIECALRMGLQYWQMEGQEKRTRFVAFDRAYHGDTIGAASLGGISTFRDRLGNLGVPVFHATDLDSLREMKESEIAQLAGVVIEPLIQGAAGMRLWPKGMLRELRAWCDAHDVFLILDEVMTGFGRTGKLFACEHEDVVPDFIALAKGLTGGTLPLAATLTTTRVFDAFLGRPEEHRTFYYGHTYCGNPLGCAAALASLAIFEKDQVIDQLSAKVIHLQKSLETWANEDTRVREVRQCGLIVGIEIGDRLGASLPPAARTGAQVCIAARAHGLLTRPVNDTLVLIPPLCITLHEIDLALTALRLALDKVVP
ncbi:MAG: adenosylmethionine-8-amino-7-oxononanoate aminotransferase [Verrucomicrobiales bacterium]|jgi:adenosylmethionine-8-amino-7-oxononanoate aminotransferase